MRLDYSNIMALKLQRIAYDMTQSHKARWTTIYLLDSGSWASIKESPQISMEL